MIFLNLGSTSDSTFAWQKSEIKYTSDYKNEWIKYAFLLFGVKGQHFLVLSLVTQRAASSSSFQYAFWH